MDPFPYLVIPPAASCLPVPPLSYLWFLVSLAVLCPPVDPLPYLWFLPPPRGPPSPICDSPRPLVDPLPYLWFPPPPCGPPPLSVIPPAPLWTPSPICDSPRLLVDPLPYLWFLPPPCGPPPLSVIPPVSSWTPSPICDSSRPLVDPLPYLWFPPSPRGPPPLSVIPPAPLWTPSPISDSPRLLVDPLPYLWFLPPPCGPPPLSVIPPAPLWTPSPIWFPPPPRGPPPLSVIPPAPSWTPSPICDSSRPLVDPLPYLWFPPSPRGPPPLSVIPPAPLWTPSPICDSSRPLVDPLPYLWFPPPPRGPPPLSVIPPAPSWTPSPICDSPRPLVDPFLLRTCQTCRDAVVEREGRPEPGACVWTVPAHLVLRRRHLGAHEGRPAGETVLQGGLRAPPPSPPTVRHTATCCRVDCWKGARLALTLRPKRTPRATVTVFKPLPLPWVLYVFSCDCRTELSSVKCEIVGDSRLKRSESLSVDVSGRRHGARDRAVGLCDSRWSCVCLLFESVVLGYQTAWLGWCWTEWWEISIMWVSTMMLSPHFLNEFVWVRSCFVNEFPTSLTLF